MFVVIIALHVIGVAIIFLILAHYIPKIRKERKESLAEQATQDGAIVID
jgi:hypothetical protein